MDKVLVKLDHKDCPVETTEDQISESQAVKLDHAVVAVVTILVHNSESQAAQASHVD
ncbi:hypothetical protein LAJ58_12340 [Streptococcus pneumoniae]|nr:hypothetical protein [Streptococcus pneumoniae]MBZ4302130.1 hypothetical protein [Streptococcus pneumoniae]